MKTTNKILALALMAVAMVFASCSKDDNDSVGPTQQEIETKIIGKWKKISENGVPMLTNLRGVQSFSSNGKGTGSFSGLYRVGYIWNNKVEMKYSVSGNILYVDISEASKTVFYETINSINLDAFSAHEKRISGGVKVTESEVAFQRITADYSQDIIGMWEGTAMTGYETYGNAEARIEYRADGTYTYYKKQGDYWVPSTNVDNEYNVDGDWLATRWRPEAGADYNYEWWDIDYIKDGIMKWSALREKEDGTRFTTTFTWKKVVMPTQQKIEENIVGKWKVTTVNGIECLTNNRKVQTFMNDGTGAASMSETRSAESGHVWESQEPFTYIISNNEVCLKMNSGKRVMYYSISDISNERFTTCLYKNVITNGPVLTPNEMCVVEKVTADYTQDIIGMWEGVEMTGDETYGNAEARIAYHADGTYTYYKKENGEWQPLEDVFDEWNVDGDWLATRWQNQGSDVMNYEWWDIDYIKDGTMKWSALREKEDGTRFKTTFTWKKVK